MLSTERIDCPYCGETIEISIDESIEHQQYIEDCFVCCRPINIAVTVDPQNGIGLRCWSESEM